MQNATIAQQFLQQYLPPQFSRGLDFKAMKLENSTYIDKTLRETISDLVFTCPYINSDEIAKNEAGNNETGSKLTQDVNVVILVEHQSVPDRLMPFRVFHYLLNLMDLDDHLQLEFVQSLLQYLLLVGNAVDLAQFKENSQHLIEPIRGEFMTIAEQLEAIGVARGRKEGREEGLEEGREKTAINLLKEGMDPEFTARISGLELAAVFRLKAQLEDDCKCTDQP